MKFLIVLGVCAILGNVAVNAGGNSGESGESFGDSSAEERGRCYCKRYTCTGLNAAPVIGCPNTNAFMQCTGAMCAVQACPVGQVWNFLRNTCAACDAGKHISADGQVCACNLGTTLDSRTGACVPCPTGATALPDMCYCPYTTARDYVNNVCKACPVDAVLGREGQCQCINPTLFFNPITWSCSACPGTLVAPMRRGARYSCRCTGLNQIFYQRNFSCYTCPTGVAMPDNDNDSCSCARYTGLQFDYTTGTCACKLGYSLIGGICTRGTAVILNP